MRKNSFTLIETVVAIIIIGILATVAVVMFNGDYANQRRCAYNLRTIANAIEKYRENTGSYPIPAPGSTLKDLLNNSTYISDSSIFKCPLDTGNDSYSDYYVPPTDYASMSQFLIGCARHENGASSLNVFFQGQLFKQKVVRAEGGKGPGDIIYAGDKITLPGGQGVIDFISGSGTAKIVQLVDIGNGRCSLTIEATNSEVYFNKIDVNITSGSRCTIITPAAVAGVEGTKFRTRIKERGSLSTTRVSVREGAVKVANQRGRKIVMSYKVVEVKRKQKQNGTYEYFRPHFVQSNNGDFE